MTAEQCADVDAEQEADVDEDEDLAVATLLDEEEETYEGVDGEVAVVERADEDGEERMPTTTQRLATTTRMTVDWSSLSAGNYEWQVNVPVCPSFQCMGCYLQFFSHFEL